MRRRYWMCPRCETMCLLSQATCGACGGEQSGDVADVDVADVYALTLDAAYTKVGKQRKR